MKNLVNWGKALPSLFNHESTHPFLKEIDRAISEFYAALKKSSFYPFDLNKLIINPSVDVVEDEQSYKVEVELPGMGAEDIKINISDGVLCIRGKKEISTKNTEKNYVSREISYGAYERCIHLPDYVEVDKADASFKKGMLWVNFPKKLGSEKKHYDIEIKKVS